MQWGLEAFPLTWPIHHAFPRGVVGRFERVWNRTAPSPRGNRRAVRTGCMLYDCVIFNCRGRGAGRFRLKFICIEWVVVALAIGTPPHYHDTQSLYDGTRPLYHGTQPLDDGTQPLHHDTSFTQSLYHSQASHDEKSVAKITNLNISLHTHTHTHNIYTAPRQTRNRSANAHARKQQVQSHVSSSS